MAFRTRISFWKSQGLAWGLCSVFILTSGFSPDIFGRRTDSNTIKKVVIDAGHGGQDTGNPGTGRYKSREKDVALEVAMMVGAMIKDRMPDVEVLYTRNKDYFVTLHERTAFANRNKADLFISIHCDAFTSSAAVGSSTFVMGKDHGDENLRVAQQENSVIFLEEDYKEQYEGFDPSKPETYIALTLYQNHFQERSILLADRIQTRFREQVGRKDRGVKQQPLWVTSRASMPAVLIELGFLTNKAEEDFLNSPKGKTALSEQIAEAVHDYRKMVSFLDIPSKVSGTPTAQSADSSKSAEVVPAEKASPKPIYRIQLKTTAKPLSAEQQKVFGELSPILESKDGGRYRYLYGAFEGYDRARAELDRVKKSGHSDAFIAAEIYGKRVDVEEARKLEKANL